MKSPGIRKPASSVTRFCLLYCLATFFCRVFALEDCHFPAIFNFGDSNSDTGAYSAAFNPYRSPYGETYFGMPSGRPSDGRLIIDFIANSLGLPFLSAYLDSLGANYTQGANFAISFSTIKPLGRTLQIQGTEFSPLYLAVEYAQFQQFKSRSQMVRNRGYIFASLTPEEDYFSRGLYMIDIGQNDIGDALFHNMTVGEVNATVPDLVNMVSEHVKALYLLGARSFWIHNTGPLGCFAYILARLSLPLDQYDSAGCGKPFNSVAQYYNQLLKQTVIKLRIELPLAAVTYVDIYSIHYSFFSQPEKYGFVQPLVVCCGSGGKYNYNGTVTCGLTDYSCLNPSVKVNWDGAHYTEAANRATFNQISTGAFSDPPITPRLACHRSVP